MKYCKRCFRNIFEDVSVCPHCGKADKLIDYEKEREKNGEDFSCNSNSTLSSHIKKDDAYSIGNRDADDVYGNTKRHDLDNCENSNDRKRENRNTGSAAANAKNLEYLKSLSPDERRKLIEEKQQELRRRYGANPSEESTNGAVIKINGREISVDDFRKNADLYKNDPEWQRRLNENTANAKKVLIMIAIFMFVFFPVVTIPLAIIIGISYLFAKKKE